MSLRRKSCHPVTALHHCFLRPVPTPAIPKDRIAGGHVDAVPFLRPEASVRNSEIPPCDGGWIAMRQHVRPLWLRRAEERWDREAEVNVCGKWGEREREHDKPLVERMILW